MNINISEHTEVLCVSIIFAKCVLKISERFLGLVLIKSPFFYPVPQTRLSHLVHEQDYAPN